MIAIFKKELNHFFSSLIGYISIGIFLLLTGNALWFFNGSILDYGYATLESLFNIAPVVFLILIPAVTMRSFSEEKNMGTLELLMTKPLRDIDIIVGKYLAALVLVIFSIVPTLIYFYSVYKLGAPVGNIDTGGVWGSYIGLLFLGASFTAIGIFCSTLSSNQIVAFILSATFCAASYWLFDIIAEFPIFSSGLDYFIQQLGINAHYKSISRGIVDTRDILYFLSVIIFFLAGTKNCVGEQKMVIDMKDKKQMTTNTDAKKRRSNSLYFLFGVFISLLLINFIATRFYTRFDLTKEKRYSLVKPTKTLLRNLDDVVSVQVYLDKNVNAGVLRLRNSVEDIMNEFKAYGGGNFEFEFLDPLAGKTEAQQIEVIKEFKKKGILGTNLKVQSTDGFQQKYILPGAIVTYRGRQMPVNLLENQIGYTPEDNLNNSIIGLEYKFSSAINKLKQHHKPRILFTQGHGELMPIEMLDIANTLQEAEYEVGEFDLSSNYRIPTDVACLVVAKPQTRFEEKDKFKIDQYIMNGGKVLWLRESVSADMDSLRNAEQMFMALPTEDNLDDMFFTYGARINQDLVQDIQLCNPIPLVTGNLGGQPQTQLFPWYYFPLLIPAENNHPIARNLDPVASYFTSTIDTIKSAAVKKTILLTTTKYSKALMAPVRVHLAMIREKADATKYIEPNLPCAVLLEGKFTSVFKNRIADSYLDVADTVKELKFLDSGKETKMIVIADGDIIRNEVQRTGDIWPLGYYSISGQTLANKTFIMNCIEYLTDDDGLIESRSKEIKVRLLDKQKVKTESTKWKVINTLLPIILVVVFGLIYAFIRKRKYAK